MNKIFIFFERRKEFVSSFQFLIYEVIEIYIKSEP